MFASLIRSSDPLGLFTASDCNTLGDAIETLIPLSRPYLESLPCANHCLNPGKLPCGKCRLVSYCSQKYCLPNGPQHDDQRPRLPEAEIAANALLVGDLPAVNIINLKNNEVDETRDFSLAFVASGDLRNVVCTVNALATNYTGRLHILLNDTSKAIVSRNIVLLLILGAMPNEAVAADIALHFWYSVFLPEDHRLRILASLLLLFQHDTDKTESFSFNLGRHAKLTCLVPREITDHLLYTVGPTLSTFQARNEYERIVTPARLDAENRGLVRVKPCQGLAFMAFWRSGVVLPFSVDSDHHTVPNASFFSCLGTWLSNDVANPLASWELNEVIKIGQTYGAQAEDVFGCLYFFLTDQFRKFAKRIRELDITFYVFNTPAHTLAQDIRSGQYSRYGLTPSVRFNRVDLAHTFGEPEHTIRDVLSAWTPLLAEGDTAAIVGVFLNWTKIQKDGGATGADKAVVIPTIEKLVKLGRLPPRTTPEDALATEAALLDAAYDNSKVFSNFLKNALNELLRELTLKRRLKHKILPQRIRMPVDAKASDLPHLPDDETWYRYMRLARVPFTARYVEIVRKVV